MRDFVVEEGEKYSLNTLIIVIEFYICPMQLGGTLYERFCS